MCINILRLELSRAAQNVHDVLAVLHTLKALLINAKHKPTLVNLMFGVIFTTHSNYLIVESINYV